MPRTGRRGNGAGCRAFRAGAAPEIPGEVRDPGAGIRAGGHSRAFGEGRKSRAMVDCMNAREWSLRIAELSRRENSSLVDLLLALAEFDRLGVWRQLGHASLFDFLHREVGLSRGSAYYRQVASRLLGRFPEIAEPLRDGRLCISNVPQLAKVMTEENRATVVAKFFHCSKQEARQVVAEILPAEVVPTRTVVTVVAPVKPAAAIVQPVGRDQSLPEGDRPAPEVRRTVVEPLTRTETRMHVTVSPEFVALLKKAKAGQSHVQPGATDEQVLTAALELLIAQQEKRRASRSSPREARGPEAGRGQVYVALGGRWHLRRHHPPADRSRGAPREGRSFDRGQLQGPLRRPQPRSRTPSIRRRAHGPVRSTATPRLRTGRGMGHVLAPRSSRYAGALRHPGCIEKPFTGGVASTSTGGRS